jgi:signal transduction histidine kinase
VDNEIIKKKVPLTHKVWARVMAFVLFVLLVPTALLSAVTVSMAAEDNWYSPRQVGYYDSAICENLARQDAYEVLRSAAGGWYDAEYYDARYNNFLFVVYDEAGNAVAQNCDGQPAVYLEDVQSSWAYDVYDEDGGAHAERLTIDCYVQHPLVVQDRYYWGQQLFDALYAGRYAVIAIGAASAILALILFIFMLCAAGHREGVEGYAPSWQDRIPLDLYLVVAVGLCCIPMAATDSLWYSSTAYTIAVVVTIVIVACLGMAALITIASRIKMGKWWRNTLLWRFRGLIWKWCRKLWGVIARIGRSLPVIWKTVLIFCGFMLLNLLCIIPAVYGSGLAILLLLTVDIGAFILLCFFAIELRALQSAGRALAGGDLDYKVNVNKLHLDLKEHGENLNNISSGMQRAVEERMKSEHFKTELITNVSHDIKTPLTSIINYVDLLKKENIESPKAQEYLEVLDRQSARLKKLTEDLVEASKASSGTISVDLQETNVTELLDQAVGEYRDRFRAAGIEPVVSAPEEKLTVLADGRLLWRVFDNLLGNIRKYSQPGTRAYFTLDVDAERVWIIFKNISREVLNISAEELQERFVRGDSSRHTEGSGLGLSIARSLTELQGGAFRLFVDGDLFKVMLVFTRFRG